MIRRVPIVLALALGATPAVAASAPSQWQVPIPGDPANTAADGCETWIDTRSDGSTRFINELQASGYLAGIVIASNLTDQTGMAGSAQRIGAWLDVYCDAHRWDTVEHALSGLAVDMAAAGQIK